MLAGWEAFFKNGSSPFIPISVTRENIVQDNLRMLSSTQQGEICDPIVVGPKKNIYIYVSVYGNVSDSLFFFQTTKSGMPN